MQRLDELWRHSEGEPPPFLLTQLAEQYRRAGSLDQAVDCCRRALAQQPGYVEARALLGRLQIDLGHHEQAGRELEQVLRRTPDHLNAIRDLAGLHRQQGLLTSARDLYKRARNLDQDDASLGETLAALDREIGEVERRSADQRPVDLDDVLVRLGAPDHQPPPLMEALLTDPSRLAAMAAAVKLPDEAEILSELEAWLAALAGRRSKLPST